MVFIDTSAIYALADRGDPNHGRATECFSALLGSGDRLLTHNYVLLESMALLQRRLGLDVAMQFADDAAALEVEWISRSMHDAAVEALREAGSRTVSLVDQVSFMLMEGRGASRAFAFDEDFSARGIDLVATE